MASPAVWGEGVWGDFVWGEDSQPAATSSVIHRTAPGPRPADASWMRPKPEYVRAPTRAEGLAMIHAVKNVHKRGGTAPQRPAQSPLSMIRKPDEQAITAGPNQSGL